MHRAIIVSLNLALTACAQTAPAQQAAPAAGPQVHRAPAPAHEEPRRDDTGRKLDAIDAAIRAAQRRLIDRQDAQQAREYKP